MPRLTLLVLAAALGVLVFAWAGVPSRSASAEVTFAQADLNSDGAVNSTDLLITARGIVPQADVNRDGVTDANDIAAVAAVALRHDPAPTATPSAAGPGWFGSYFANTSFAGAPALIRQDANIDFTWTGAPDAAVPADYFSVRWTQFMIVPAGSYTFTLTHDDGARLYIDGNLVMDEWFMQGPRTYAKQISLSAAPHQVTVDYFTTYGLAVAKLSVQADGSPQAAASSASPPTSTITASPTATATSTVTATSALVAPSATATDTSTATATETATATAAPTMTTTPTPTATTQTLLTPELPPTSTPTVALSTSAPMVPAPAMPTSVLSGTRDKFLWPFSATSIWNMPIGSGAVYVPANIQLASAWKGGEITTDDEYLGLDPSAPLRPLNGGSTLVHVPAFMAASGSWNSVAAFLTDDGRVVQGQPLVLAAGGDPSWQYNYPTVDLAGDGIDGAHGGSGLSSFGGSVRKGELSSASPLQHALKVNLFGQRFLSISNGGFRWPARHSDAYASPTTYGGQVEALRMGSLLALAPDVDIEALGLQSAQARKIAHAMQDYGAYVADDTAWDVHAIDIEKGAEFGDGGSFHADLQRIFTMLSVVDNNSASSIGGGGVPRLPLAPIIGN